jgi:hypothetical protein
MPHVILGAGLVTPFGLSPRQNAFFLRAGVPPTPATPFAGPEDERVRAHCCPLFAASTPARARLAELAGAAAEQALAPLAAGATPRFGLVWCAEPARPGLGDDDQRHAREAVARRLGATWVTSLTGGAPFFAALAAVDTHLQRDRVDAVLVVAADTFISLEWLAHQAARTPPVWMLWPPVPSEAGAALLLARPEVARGARVWGRVVKSAAVAAPSNDDNDDVADGAAMSAAIRQVAPPAVHYVFGQGLVDPLRRREWSLAAARNAERFRGGHEEICLESDLGSIGNAAGAACLVHGMAAIRHRTLDFGWSTKEPFLAWSISRDGTRGLASVEVRAHE